jgi:hypothetical protein
LRGQAFDCAGAPRDLGLDEARALGRSLEETVRRATLDWFAPGNLTLGARLARRRQLSELAEATRRHFPHLAERTEGLTKGMGLARRAIWPLLARELCWREGCYGSTGGMALGFSGMRTRCGGAALGKILDLPRGREDELVLRRSAPENDYRSVELAVAGLPSAIAGLNERGLAVMVVSSESATSEAAVPAMLLVQDCLQRFASSENAAQWCRTRPASSGVSLVFADAQHVVLGVALDGDERRTLHAEQEMLCVGRPEAAAAAKCVFDGAMQWDAQRFFETVGAASLGDSLLCRHDGPVVTAGALWLCPAEGSLTWLPSRPCGQAPIVVKL